MSVVQALVGRRGWMRLVKLRVESLATEEFLLTPALLDDGQALDEEVCELLLRVPATVEGPADPIYPRERLDGVAAAQVASRLEEVEFRNGRFFDEEVAKLDRWADDLKFGLEREIRELDKEIRDARRGARSATSLTEKLAAQKRIRTIEGKRNRKRRELYEAQDRVDRQRDELIGQIERQLAQTHSTETIFTFEWTIA